MFVASTIFIIPLGFSFKMNSLDTISSAVYGDRLYMPGKSVTKVSGLPFIAPLFLSTVTPGKLPTCWLEPVN